MKHALPLLLFVSAFSAHAAVAKAHCDTPVERSRCMIKAVLKDVQRTYTNPGGGGITEIRQTATDEYRVSIAQEERVDRITYKLSLSPKGKPVILKRTEDTESKGR